MEPAEPVRKGDVIEWRDAFYVVKRVSKWTVHLIGAHNDVRLRCLKPIADGGFSEARIVRRAGY